MSTYEIIKSLCDKSGIAVTYLEKQLGFGRGSIGKLRQGSTSIERLQKIADYFNVTVEYLSTGKEHSESSLEGEQLNSKDKKDIRTILSETEQLLKQEGLMFDGDPASQEAIDSILSAMQIGMEMAKKKNKEKYTPKKYKKD